MSYTIKANLTIMFKGHDPYDVSNSVFNLGPSAARQTWYNALEIAREHGRWLREIKPSEAADIMRGWARESGGWDREEISEWSIEECLALFAQNIASELRELGSDNTSIVECCRPCDSHSEVTGNYYNRGGNSFVEWYGGI